MSTPEDVASQERDRESSDRDREAYERYKAAHPEGQDAPKEDEEPRKRDDEFSHYLHLADGNIVKHDAADGPVPAEVEGVPVASVYPATVGKAT